SRGGRSSRKGRGSGKGRGGRVSRGGRMSLDRICLEGLRGFGAHGVREHEQRDGQEFIIDAVLWLDTRAAAANDDLSLTVDYGAVADRLGRVGPRGRREGPAKPAPRRPPLCVC